MPETYPVLRTVLGRKMWLPEFWDKPFAQWYEADITKTIRESLKPGDTAIDVGANIGYHTLTMCECVGESGWVEAYEPETENFGLLCMNIAQDGHALACTANIDAVGDTRQMGTLFLSPTNLGDHRLYSFDLKQPAQTVSIVTLDDDTDKDMRRFVRLVKIDTQGWDYRVWRGMQKIVAESPNLIIITEVAPAWMRGAGDDPKRYVQELHDAGFSLAQPLQKPMSLDDVFAAIDKCGDTTYINLVCRKTP